MLQYDVQEAGVNLLNMAHYYCLIVLIAVRSRAVQIFFLVVKDPALVFYFCVGFFELKLNLFYIISVCTIIMVDL